MEDCGDNRYFVRCKCGIAQDKLYYQKCDASRRWNTRKGRAWTSCRVSMPHVKFDGLGNWSSGEYLLRFADNHYEIGTYNPIGVFEDWRAEDGPLYVGAPDADDDSLRVVSWAPLDQLE